MVSGVKFYIHAGGRWREVDLNDGRVEGWGKGTFVYAKRGKVQVAKTGAILTGLRDLAAGQHSAVKDDMALPFKITEDIKTKLKKDVKNACDSSLCCKHSRNNNRCIQQTIEKPAVRVSTGVQCVDKADVSIQTTQSLAFPDHFDKQNEQKKRRRESTTSEDNAPTKKTHSNTPKKAKRKRSASDSSVENRPPNKKVPSLKLQRADSAKYSLYKRRRSKSSDSVVWVVLPKKKENGNNVTKSTKHSPIKESKKAPKSPQKHLNNKTKPKQQKILSVNLKDDDIIPISLFNKPHTNDDTKGEDQCKELLIDETDVDLLRNFLIKHDPNFDLLKFDEDDEYKRHLFYKINPLVNVERCPKIAVMLRRESQDEMSLKDFVSVLGLKSIKDIALVPKRYKMRKLGNRSYLDRKDPTYSNQTEKENSGLTKLTHRSDKKINKSTSEDSTDSETEDLSEENQDRRRSRRLDKSLRESNRGESERKIYKTRQSGGDQIESKSTNHIADVKERIKNNVSKKLTEILSSEKQRSRNNRVTSDSNTDSEEYSSDEVSKKSKNKGILSKHITDITSTEDEEYVKPKNKANDERNSKTIEISDSNDNSEAETKNISKNSKRDKIKLKQKKEEKDLIDYEGKKGLRSKDIKKVHAKHNAKKYASDDDSETDSKSFQDVGNHKTKVLYVNKNRNISDSEEFSDTAKSTFTKSAIEDRDSKKKEVRKVNNHTNREDSKSKLKKQNDVNKNKDTKEIEVNSKTESLEKHVNGKVINNKTTDTLELSSDDANEAPTKPKRPVKETKTSAPNSISRKPLSTLMYSNLEDHAIVTWISTGGRAACVNGNRIWRDLETQFGNITGQKRTWHSLRNRYLRYILPSLGEMALPPAQVSRLRAAAATGEIKSRKRPSRRNSIFPEAASGALSRRPRARSPSEEPPPKRHKHDGKRALQESPKRITRLSLAGSQQQSSPRYSDITRHFAATHRHTSSTPTGQKTPKNADTPTTTDSEETTSKSTRKHSLSLRRSFRNKDSSDQEKSEKNKSSAKSSEKNRPSEKSSISSVKSSEKNRSSARSPEKTRSSAKSPEKTRSSAKSPEKTRSSAKSPEKTRSSIKSSEKNRNSSKLSENRPRTRKLYNPGVVL